VGAERELQPAAPAGALDRRIASTLAKTPLFSDLAAWQIERIEDGTVSEHTYKLSRGETVCFVKQVKDNEAFALKLVDGLDLDIAPRVLLPELLAQHLLVAEYIPGGPLREKKLEPQLIVKFAELQNRLNNPALFAGRGTFSGCPSMVQDDGFFWRGHYQNCEQGYARLLKFRDTGHPMAEPYLAIAEQLRPARIQLITAFCAMPFAWQHHDFKEANIVGTPQRLVDWGSSYGHGPFLYDLAPFLIADPAGLDLFVQHAQACRHVSADQVQRWLYVALCARFFDYVVNRIREDGGIGYARDAENGPLEHEYETYRLLLSN
jgi:hypothetical protein